MELTEGQKKARAVACPFCQAREGKACRTVSSKLKRRIDHVDRFVAAGVTDGVRFGSWRSRRYMDMKGESHTLKNYTAQSCTDYEVKMGVNYMTQARKGQEALKSAKLAALARDAAKASRIYEEAVRAHERFGDEFEIGTVLRFKHVFGNAMGGYNQYNTTAYDYVALRGENGFWYLTSSNTNRKTWDELVEFIGDAECHVIAADSKAWKKI